MSPIAKTKLTPHSPSVQQDNSWGIDILFFLSLLSVLAIRLLPTTGQSFFVIGMVCLFVGYEMLLRRDPNGLLRRGFLLETVGVLFVVTMLVVLETGGLDSDLFFFLYAVQVVVSLLLRPRHEWLVLFTMIGILLVETDMSRLFVMTTLDSLVLFLKLFSLLVFGRLILWFAARYQQNEQHEQDYEEVEALLETYELEDVFLAQSVSAGVLILDDKGKVIETNEAALRILAIGEEEVVGVSLERLMLPLPAKADQLYAEMGLAGGKKTRCRLWRHALSSAGKIIQGELVVFEDERLCRLMDKHHPLLPDAAAGES